jgi:hypothetical protein
MDIGQRQLTDQQPAINKGKILNYLCLYIIMIFTFNYDSKHLKDDEADGLKSWKEKV